LNKEASIEWGFTRSISGNFEVDLCVCGDIGPYRRIGTAYQSIGKISLIEGFRKVRQ
jgi:hypothetical protein